MLESFFLCHATFATRATLLKYIKTQPKQEIVRLHAKMRQQHYGPVPLHDKDDDEHDNSEDLLLQRRSNSRSWPKLIWHGLALCSIIVNLVFLPILLSESSSCQAKSQYGKKLLSAIFNLRTQLITLPAGLVLGSERSAWKFRSEWYSRNRTSSDALWDAISFDAGMIALNDEEAAAMGLPLSERFPWDQNKGIYLVNAYHNLHCLVWATNPPPPLFSDGTKRERALFANICYISPC